MRTGFANKNDRTYYSFRNVHALILRGIRKTADVLIKQ